ncbi:MAG: hypothetical protein KUG82_10815 [Pseudomonadales bacterium]|nr:hypothetical protein [Pseudomonadales bacterium]
MKFSSQTQIDLNGYRYIKAIFVTLVISSASLHSYAASLDDISLNGYLSAEYEKHIGGDNEGDKNGSFDMDLIDLVFNIRATDKLRIATDLTWEHGAASEENRGNVAVEYAFAEYLISNNTKIRVGKMFTNFGIYNEIHTAKPATLTVKEPQSTNKNNKLGSEIRFYPRWLMGVAVVGTYQLSKMGGDYVLQLSNGESEDEDINPFEEDDNTHKAFNGRFRLRYTDAIQLGFSFFLDSMEDPNSSGRIDLSSYGLQADWENENGTGLEFEFVLGDEDYSQAQKISRYAYTAMLYQQLNEKYTPYLRYEYLDPDKNTSRDTGTVSILGINIMIDESMFLKIEADHFSTKENNGKFNGASFTDLKVSLSIGF